ncbi:MAG: hypothetical protein AAGD32_02715 [Planctomycetota bacterium]
MTQPSRFGAALAFGMFGAAIFPATEAMAAVLNFTLADALAEVDVTLTDVPTGVQVDLTVDTSTTGNFADIRAFFVDLSDDTLLGGLGFVGADVTDHDFSGSVSNLGNGANVNPDSYEGGIEIGTPGASPDMHTTTTFVLTHPGLDVVDLFGERVAVRATSVGTDPTGDGNNGSVKLTGTAIPEPTILGGLALLPLLRRRR